MKGQVCSRGRRKHGVSEGLVDEHDGRADGLEMRPVSWPKAGLLRSGKAV